MKLNKYTIILLSLFSIPFIVLLVGYIYEYCGKKAFITEHKPTEKYIEVNGNTIHYVIKGNKQPTTILIGSFISFNEELIDTLAQHTTVIAYDRSGIGWSETPENEKSIESIENEFIQLITKLDVSDRYIFIVENDHAPFAYKLIEKLKNNTDGIIIFNPARSIINPALKSINHAQDAINSIFSNDIFFKYGLVRFIISLTENQILKEMLDFFDMHTLCKATVGQENAILSQMNLTTFDYNSITSIPLYSIVSLDELPQYSNERIINTNKEHIENFSISKLVTCDTTNRTTKMKGIYAGIQWIQGVNSSR